MSILSVIIDDEQLARERLAKMLKVHSHVVRIIGEASNGEEGAALVEDLRPELIFLDIEMPVMGGFEMLKKISYQPRIIFTTAYDEYAIKAFEQNSIDYLLKPIEEERLAWSIQKLASFEKRPEQDQVSQLLKKLHTEELKTISVTLGDRITLVKKEDIVYFHAEDKYVLVYDRVGSRHLISTTLTELEHQLGSSFVRIHRSYILNRAFVKEIRKSVNGKLTFYMAGVKSVQLTSSQGYTPAVRRAFQV